MPDKVQMEYRVELRGDPQGGLLLEVTSPTGEAFQISSTHNLEALVREVGKGFDSLQRSERYMVMRKIQHEFFLYTRRHPSIATNTRTFYDHLLTARILHLERQLEELERKH